jgi:hypothetical protein
MYEDLKQPDLVVKVQRDIAARMQDLNLAIDAYAKLLVELELLELEAPEAQGSSTISAQSEQPSE